MKVLLTGGGSGGHVSPALAVAKLLRNSSSSDTLLYVGGRMTMEGSTGPSIEESLVKPTGIPFKTVSSGKLRRDGFSLTTFKRLWGFVPGVFQAIWIVKQFSPDVVFSSGGYVSLPVVLAAALWRVPIVIHEQTAAVGLTNSLSAKVASKIAITFPQSADFFPASKVVVTGNPIRQEVLSPKPENQDFVEWVDSADKPLLFVTGGGQGSHILNTTIEAMLPELLESYCLVHQCGAHAQFQDFERLSLAKENFSPKMAGRYWLNRHFTPDEMGYLMARAALVVGRSGANTVLELAAVGTPAVFVPIPWVTHDEQTKNAKVLVDVGLAAIVPEKELNPKSLLHGIEEVLSRQSLPEAKVKARSLVDFEAAQRLVALLREQAK